MNTPAPEKKNFRNPLQRMRRERRLAFLLVLAFLAVTAIASIAAMMAPQLADSPQPTESSQDAIR